MQYNVCTYCGACDGRAGILVASPSLGIKDACANCYDTLGSGNATLHTNLSRTDEEIQKTLNLLNNTNAKSS